MKPPRRLGVSLHASSTALVTVTQTAPIAADNLAGYWRTMASTSTGQGNLVTFSTPLTGVDGQRIRLAARVRTTGVEAAVAAGQTASIVLRLFFLNDANTVLGYAPALHTLPTFDVDLADAVVVAESAVPAGTTKFQLEQMIYGASTSYPIQFQLGEVLINNQSALSS